MLEEYVCLGGNEVANNARVYGYATSSGCPASWFRCEPCEAIHDVTTDWIPPTFRLYETRRNLFSDPSADTGTATWWAADGTTLSKTSGAAFGTAFAARFTATTAIAAPGMRLPSLLATATVASVRFSVRGSSNQLYSLRYRPLGPTTPGGEVIIQDVHAAPEVQEIAATFTTSASAATANAAIVLLTGNAVVGQWVEITKVVVERADFPGPFFDGDTPDAKPDYYEWVGAADASQSIVLRETVEQTGRSTEPPYTVQNIRLAPWYDAQSPELTGGFYGVYVITIENLNSSTRTATATEGILDGGVVGLVRHSTREMRTRALLVASNDDSLEYGLAWLSAALAADTCSSHGGSCGAVDMTFFSSCPETPDPLSTVVVEVPQSRYMHNVTVTSGPLVEQKIKSNDGVHVGYIVEWTMVAGTPWVFSETREVSVNLQPPVVVQDVPYNLVPFPSAELSTGVVTLATNYSTNPSVETNATGWSTVATVITPAPTGARSTEIAAQGTASFKSSVTATNSGTNGTLVIYQDVTLPAFVTGQRFSANMWAFGAVVSGTAALTDIEIKVDWLASGPSYISSSILGTIPISGGALSGASLVRPANAILARIQATLRVSSWSTGAALNLFADAAAVTIP
jgi:hypothetical protein